MAAVTDEEMQDQSTSTTLPPEVPLSLTHLPATLLGRHVIEYLSLAETRRFLTINQQLYRQLPEIESHRTLWRLPPEAESADRRELYRAASYIPNNSHPRLYHWNKIVELDAGPHGTNLMIRALVWHMPALQRLSLVNSQGVSHRHHVRRGTHPPRRTPSAIAGLECLPRLRHLRYVDLTYCDNVSYHDTLLLRGSMLAAAAAEQQQSTTTPNNHHPPSIIIRRQPSWMDGRFETPFANDGVHTYWPDGSFQYERAQASRGFLLRVRRIVRDDRDDSQHRVQTKVQYTNFDPPNGAWPEWARQMYRPGVSLLWRDGDDAEIENTTTAAADDNNTDSTVTTKGEKHSPPPREKGTILVAQRTRGMHPPSDEWPKVEHWSLPIGKSVYFDRDGSRLSDDAADDDNSDRRFVMVTRMRVRPLETLTPPAELLEQNRNFVQQYTGRHGGAEHAMEENLHRMLGGED